MTISPEAFMTQPPEPDEDGEFVDVVLTRGPGPDSDFVELEGPSGRSLGPESGADWVDRGDGFAVLRIPHAGQASDPLDAIAQSLRQLVELQEERNGWNRPRELTVNAPTAADICAAESDGLSEVVGAAREAYDDLEAKYNALFKLLADVEKIIAPSTSKLANSVRAAITEWRNPEVPDPEPDAGALCSCGSDATSLNPAEVVVHRADGPCTIKTAAAGPVPAANAAEMGHAAPAHDADVEEWRAYARSLGYTGPDVDKANRAQIRTMLGIVQPVAEDEGATA